MFFIYHFLEMVRVETLNHLFFFIYHYYHIVDILEAQSICQSLSYGQSLNKEALVII